MKTATKKKLLYFGYAAVVLLTVLALIFTICALKNMAEAGEGFDALGAAFLIIFCVIALPGVLLVEFEVFYTIKYFFFSSRKTKTQTVINVVCLALPLFVLGVLFLLTEYTFVGNAPGVIYFLWLGAHLLFRLLYFTIGAGRAKPAARE